MQKIQIETTQNVTVEYEIAGVGRRLAASMIDGIIETGYLIAAIMSLTFFRSLTNGISGIYLIFILFIPVIFYDLLCETLMNGQSFGKKSMKIKVVRLDGGQPTFLNYFLRWLLRIVDFYISYGAVAFITILVNGKGQRLGDLAANTTVIWLKTDTSLQDTILTEVQDNYQVKFQEASALSDRDAGIIKEVIEAWNETEYEDTHEKVLLRTKEVIAGKLGIVTQMPALPFLQTILKDYNYINSK